MTSRRACPYASRRGRQAKGAAGVGSEEFRQELRRMAQHNQIRPTFDQDKLVAALQSEINQGAEFINILPSVVADKSYLVVTTLATHSVVGGMFSVKVKWTVPHKALDNVYYQRGMLGEHVTDKLHLEAE